VRGDPPSGRLAHAASTKLRTGRHPVIRTAALGRKKFRERDPLPAWQEMRGHHKDHRRGGGTRPRQPLFADRPPAATSNLADFDPVSIGTRDPKARKGEVGRKEKTKT
jgi:hypothetical protein